jgi:hypothetical protein
MITRFITDVTTRFNPFSPSAKSARLFLSFLPPTARASGMNITTQLLPRHSTEPPTLYVKFSTFLCYSFPPHLLTSLPTSTSLPTYLPFQHSPIFDPPAGLDWTGFGLGWTGC